MKLINRTVSAFVFAGTLLASTSALALTPFQVATLAERGQIEGIPGYQTLKLRIRIGDISGADILNAAGVSGDRNDAELVENFIRSNGDDN